jgi:hypothetical protein
MGESDVSSGEHDEQDQDGAMLTAEQVNQIKERVLDAATFLHLSIKGAAQSAEPVPWIRVTARPVSIKGKRLLQFSYFDGKHDIAKNYAEPESANALDTLLAAPLRAVAVRATTEDFAIQISKRGKPLVTTTPATAPREAASLAHDASKRLPLPVGTPDAFLERLGIMDRDGRVKPGMHAKFAEINQFLVLLEQVLAAEQLSGDPLEIVDCASGAGYLTFATEHYLHDIQHRAVRLTGVDINGALVEKCNAQSQRLGLDDLQFERTAIADYAPATAPHIVLALHACDTATDEAIALGITTAAPVILCAPCCHHHLHQQLRTVDPFKPVFQHGILEQRLGDVLTDTLRALVLTLLGYKCDVIEFVSAEHTTRNVMLRAVRRAPPAPPPHAAEEYQALCRYWGVTPYLATLLGERLRAALA